MILNFRQISRVLAFTLLILAVSMVLPVITALIYGETDCLPPFFASMALLLAVSAVILKKIKPVTTDLRIRDGYFTVAMCWLLIPLASSLPYLLSGAIPGFADAFFECASGFTTTGASILTDVESLPKCMLIWRSFGHWLGGMGILVFTIALLPSLGIGGLTIVRAESTGPTLDKLTPKLSDSAKILYVMYFGMTIAEVLLLLLGGMSFFDAVIHTFGSVGTGGFSNYNSSAAHFDSLYINLVLCLFMSMAGINFTLYYYLFRGDWKKFFKDMELRVYFIILGAATLVCAGSLYFHKAYDTVGDSLEQALFQSVTIMTTTGFATADTNLWPTTCKIVLFLLMLVGGCAASTSGGIKVVRVAVLFQLIRRGIDKRLHPNAVVPVKVGDKAMSSDIVSAIASYLFLYMSVFLIGALVISLDGVDLVTAISASAACLSNIGPGFELVGSVANYSFFSDPMKLFLSFLMIAGRLELYTFLMVFVPSFWNSDR